MASFINFINTAQNIMAGVLSAIGGTNDGCTFTLSGGTNSVSFPVSPANFEIANPYNNQTVNIINLGDVNLLGKRGLRTIEFKSFFPAQAYTFVQTMSLSGPYDYVNQIRQMAESGNACHLTITGTDVSMPVTIEDFSYGERDSSGDVYFSISLKEYRYIMPTSSATNDTTALKSRTAETIENKETTKLGVMSDIDTAQKVFQKTTTIVNQGERTLGLYKAMVKSGGIKAGTILTATASAVLANGKTIYKY